MFQRMGVVAPWYDEDPGRFEVTKNPADSMVFKVPSLRNVMQTAPYFNGGEVGTAEQAVELMAHHQLGKDLTTDEISSILTFLGALTGEVPSQFAVAPEGEAQLQDQ